jgi:hypothetical protein
VTGRPLADNEYADPPTSETATTPRAAAAAHVTPRHPNCWREQVVEGDLAGIPRDFRSAMNAVVMRRTPAAEQKQPTARERQQHCRSAANAGEAPFRASPLAAFPANASGTSADHRPLADDRVPCVQLTIRPTAGALAFTKSSHAGWPCGRFCFWCEAAIVSKPTVLSRAAPPGQTRPRRVRPGEPPGARSSPEAALR